MMDMFADGFGEISLVGNTVRLDLVALSGVRDGSGQPAVEKRGRLVMPVEGFVQAFETAQRLMQLLEQQGLLPPPIPASSALKPASQSPNFAPVEATANVEPAA
jgi:hypothetical protein